MGQSLVVLVCRNWQSSRVHHSEYNGKHTLRCARHRQVGFSSHVGSQGWHLQAVIVAGTYVLVVYLVIWRRLEILNATPSILPFRLQ